jgi:hypothetical protein
VDDTEAHCPRCPLIGEFLLIEFGDDIAIVFQFIKSLIQPQIISSGKMNLVTSTQQTALY